MFEINYSQLIQYEILEKLVTYIPTKLFSLTKEKGKLMDSAQEVADVVI